MTRSILLLSLAFAACREASSDDELRRGERHVPHTAEVAAPCAGCTLDVPERADKIPLLVVFHGDGEDAHAAAKRWREPARDRGWAVLSLKCPSSEGCEGKWYRWNGHPRWVTAQVSEVRRRVEIDPDKVFLVGWSGGATYIGMNGPRWSDEFAAAVYHGGGQPPLTTSECPSHALPAYFLVGDKNWAHAAAKRLRAYYERCGIDHEWDLLDGANHAAEDDALTGAKARAILDWLEAHARGRRGILTAS